MEKTAEDASMDWPLIHSCKNPVSEYCPAQSISKEKGELLSCLIHNKNKNDIPQACRKAVRIRHMEQFTDARLNPKVMKHCDEEINEHCMMLSLIHI